MQKPFTRLAKTARRVTARLVQKSVLTMMVAHMGYVDLHSHVLPALDDGVRTLAEATELCGLLAEMGFDTVCATPHQKVGSFVPTREAIDAAYAEVKTATAGKLRLLLGAENFWDELFLSRMPESEQPTYTGKRAFLFEIRTDQLPPRFEEMLFALQLKGLLPVMAHPERYASFWHAHERLETIGRSTALVVDLGALAGAHGRQQAVAAKWLVESGVAHAVATDVHSPADAKVAGAGMAWIEKHLGAETLTRLLDTNPRSILQGALP